MDAPQRPFLPPLLTPFDPIASAASAAAMRMRHDAKLLLSPPSPSSSSVHFPAKDKLARHERDDERMREENQLFVAAKLLIRV